MVRIERMCTDIFNIATFIISVLYGVEKIVGKGENAGYQHFLVFPQCFLKLSLSGSLKVRIVWQRVNSLPNMPILRSTNSVANKDLMLKIWTNGDTIIWLSRKHCEKGRNCLLRAISHFPTLFSKAVCCYCVILSIYGVKGEPFPKQQTVRGCRWQFQIE